MILRLANVVGSGMSRGVTYDFIHKLIEDPESLHVLGNGEQLKSYIHVRDVTDAILHLLDSPQGWGVFNLATVDRLSVYEIAQIVIEEMDLHPSITCDPSPIGWPGDIPNVNLYTSKIRRLGWSSTYGSREAVRRAAVALVREAR
jgi:UDP-glucose 4-epimerase